MAPVNAPPGEGSADSAAVGVSEDPLIPERVGAFTQREQFFLQQEENGNFSFQYMQNDGQPSHNLWWVLPCIGFLHHGEALQLGCHLTPACFMASEVVLVLTG